MITEEFGNIQIDFDPSKYKTKAAAAKALYAALVKLNKESGGPAGEVFIKNPEQREAQGYGRVWHVSWESGPYQWAIGTAFEVCNYEAGWYTEPYYGFDLSFYDC